MQPVCERWGAHAPRWRPAAQETREALGVRLDGAVVIVDEAHNQARPPARPFCEPAVSLYVSMKPRHTSRPSHFQLEAIKQALWASKSGCPARGCATP